MEEASFPRRPEVMGALYSADRKVTSSSLIEAHSQRGLQLDGDCLPVTFRFLGTLHLWPMTEATVVQVSSGPRATRLGTAEVRMPEENRKSFISSTSIH